jgi:copper chaperone CopZ
MAKTTTISVGEIHCESCENTIRTALSKIDGVYQVAPSQATNQIKVSYDEQALSEADLKKNLAEIGYEPVG